jgi:hypothetical protein
LTEACEVLINVGFETEPVKSCCPMMSQYVWLAHPPSLKQNINPPTLLPPTVSNWMANGMLKGASVVPFSVKLTCAATAKKPCDLSAKND